MLVFILMHIIATHFYIIHSRKAYELPVVNNACATVNNVFGNVNNAFCRCKEKLFISIIVQNLCKINV